MVLPLLLAGAVWAGYLLNDALNPATPSEPISEPYEPPFSGGQCETAYDVTYRYRAISASAPSRNRNVTESLRVLGAINGISTNIIIRPSESTLYQIVIDARSLASPNTSPVIAGFSQGFVFDEFFAEIISIVRVDGQPDNCGNLPNPNPPLPTSDSGLAQNPNQNFGEPLTVAEGLAPSGALAALLAAANALAAAGDLLEGLGALADALKALKDALEDKDKKDDKKDRKLESRNLGRVSGDGYLELFPPDASSDVELLYLDIQIISFPIGIGRVFGRDSPNRFPFTPFGNIRFVTPTYGVLSTHFIENVRTSLTASDRAVAFFYHFGLDRRVQANIRAFYSVPQPPEPEA